MENHWCVLETFVTFTLRVKFKGEKKKERVALETQASSVPVIGSLVEGSMLRKSRETCFLKMTPEKQEIAANS